MQTDRFSLTIGVTPGYFHANENSQDVRAIWSRLVEKFSTEIGIHISATVDETIVIYPKKFGCPEGGEKIYRITGTKNPYYQPINATWHSTVINIANELRDILKQTTAQLEFDLVDLHYLKD